MSGKRDTWTRTRRVDGEPETVADTRFFDLRESGYTGPIGQDGRKATSGRAVEILAAMRRSCK
jgi:hypothetical protein